MRRFNGYLEYAGFTIVYVAVLAMLCCFVISLAL